MGAISNRGQLILLVKNKDYHGEREKLSKKIWKDKIKAKKITWFSIVQDKGHTCVFDLFCC